VRRSCEQGDKISNASSRIEDGGGVLAQQRRCMPPLFGLFLVSASYFFEGVLCFLGINSDYLISKREGVLFSY
jgi:hypothetical protein